jgi:hypothetical protein
MEQLDPVETKICRACGRNKKLKSFQTLKSGNKAGVCNLCKASGRKIPKESSKEPPKDIALMLGNVNIKDYTLMYKFLEKAGYVLSKKEDIHEQFCKKYGLTPNKPKNVFNRYYSQKDCGLI